MFSYCSKHFALKLHFSRNFSNILIFNDKLIMDKNITSILSKSQLLARVSNYHTFQKKWTPKWIHPKLLKPSTIHQQSTINNSNNNNHINRQNNSNSKFVQNKNDNNNNNTIYHPKKYEHDPKKEQHQQHQQQQQQQQQKYQNQKTGNYNKINIQNLWKWIFAIIWNLLSILDDWWCLSPYVAGGWLTWRGMFLRWSPLIGLCFIGAIQYTKHRNNGKKNNNNDDDHLEEYTGKMTKTASNWQVTIMCSLPLRLMSRAFGWLCQCDIPKMWRPFIYGSYSKMFGVNLMEAADTNLKNYRNFCEFFTRALTENARLIDLNNCIVSPADGKILHCDVITSNRIEQVKGVTYDIETFLGPINWMDPNEFDNNNNHLNTLNDYRVTEDDDDNNNNNNNNNTYLDKLKIHKDNALYQCVIYLAPGDYHRFHSATEWIPGLRRHFAGELLSVNPRIAKWLPNLFSLNERAVYIGKWNYGFFSYTAVGATNVGSIKITMDEQLKTNTWFGLTIGPEKRHEYNELLLPENLQLSKGDLLGHFNMGSTIILMFEAPKNFEFKIKAGQCIKMGEPIGNVEG